MSNENSLQISDTGLMKIENSVEAFRYANAVLKSGLAPNGFRTPEAIIVAWQQGAELGLKPMASLQHIAVINGRPTVYGKAAAGIVVNSGQAEIFEEWYENEDDNITACCKVKRRGIDSVKIAKFSLNDAKNAGLLNKAGDVWKKYPKDMLMYKARARAFSGLFGDVLCGLPIYEDYREVENTKINNRNIEAVEINDPLMDNIENAEVIEAQKVEVKEISENPDLVDSKESAKLDTENI